MLKLGPNGYISNKEYHSDHSFVSSSGFKLLLADEYEFRRKHVFGHWEDEDNAAFSFGTYLHTAILEPHLLNSSTAVYGGKARYGEAYKSFCAKNVGKTIITAAECETAARIMLNYNKMPLAKSLISQGRCEETFCAVVGGIPQKVRFDAIGSGYGLDVKTTSSPIDEKNMAQTIEKYDYALSAAMYMEVAAASGHPVKDFYFLFANKKTGHLSLIKAGPDLLDKGRKQYLDAIEKFNRLNSAGFFSNVLPIMEIVESSEVKNEPTISDSTGESEEGVETGP